MGPRVRALLATALATVVTGAAVHFSGVGGYRGGAIIAIACLAAIPATVYAATSRGVPNRWLWLGTPLVLGTIIGGLLAPLAPPSRGVLNERLDEIPSFNFEVVSSSESGHSWCRPHCPTVTRRYAGADLAPPQAVFSMAIELTSAGLIDQPPALGAPRFVAESEDMTIAVSGVRSDGDTIVTVELTAKRG